MTVFRGPRTGLRYRLGSPFADPTRRLKHLLRRICQHSRPNHRRAQPERAESPDLLTFTADEIESEEGHGGDSDRNRAKKPSGHAEWTFQPWLTDSENHQGHEFQGKARAVYEDVQRDQALEAQIEASRPANRQSDNRDPWCAPPVQLAEKLRQHAVLSHRQRKT